MSTYKKRIKTETRIKPILDFIIKSGKRTTWTDLKKNFDPINDNQLKRVLDELEKRRLVKKMKFDKRGYYFIGDFIVQNIQQQIKFIESAKGFGLFSRAIGGKEIKKLLRENKFTIYDSENVCIDELIHFLMRISNDYSGMKDNLKYLPLDINMKINVNPDELIRKKKLLLEEYMQQAKSN